MTIFVMVTGQRSAEEVFRRTPNRAAREEPKPSQATPPSSLSVASLLLPPSITPEISPTVSTTAVTTNMIQDRLGIAPGIEDQFYRHEFWNSEPGRSVGYFGPVQHPGFGKFRPRVMSVVGRKIPMTSGNDITDDDGKDCPEVLQIPLQKCFPGR